MKKIKFLIIGVIFLALIFVARKIYIHRPVYYPGVTAENFAYISVPAAENEGVYTDLTAMVTGDKAVIFLPCRADRSHVTFYCMDAKNKPLERYEVDFVNGSCTILGVPVVCMQSNLPTLEISLNDKYGTIEAVNEDVLHETSAFGDMTLSCSDELAQANGWDRVFISQDRKKSDPESMSIKGRGNNTWIMDKKPYLVRLEEDVSLLGMASGSRWVLLANVMDHALMRNEIILELARECGCEFVPDLQPVDVFVDGEYIGNYSLCSKVEISSERVNIDENRDYFYRLGMPSGYYRTINMTSVNAGRAVDLGYGSLTDGVNYVELINARGNARDDEAFEAFQTVISAIEDTDSDDFLNYIDLESWARIYWVQELSKNTDATFRSVYTYLNHEDGKMYMIAPWDFDRTIGTVEPYNNENDYLSPYKYVTRNEDWYKSLFKHEEFVQEVERVYFEGGIKEAFAGISSEAERRFPRIDASATMNFTRWDFLTRPLENYYNIIEQSMGDSSYESEKQWLILWLEKRAKWIDEEMTGTEHSEE